MDYVLFGMGYGASLMLLGWALRTFGPQLKYNKPPKEENAEYLVEQRFWVRFIQGLGGVIAIAGTAMVLMTFIVVLVNPSDSAGKNLCLSIWALILIAVLVWCWFYISKYGLAGIWSRQNGYGFRGQLPSTSLSTTEPRVAGSRRVSSRNRPERMVASSAESTTTDVATTSAAEPSESILGPEIPEDATKAEPAIPESAAEQGSGPVYDFGDGSETTVPSESSGRAEALRRLRERQARTRQSTKQ